MRPVRRLIASFRTAATPNTVRLVSHRALGHGCRSSRRVAAVSEGEAAGQVEEFSHGCLAESCTEFVVLIGTTVLDRFWYVVL